MRSRTLTFTALVAGLALVVAACGGGSGSSGGGGGGSSSEGKPVYGGKVVYGLEGKTTNFCIPSAQLAISGIMVVNSVYDTLTVPTNTPDKYAPYLAKSVTPNADFTEWTIVVRSGITFHDGTPLNADAVKQNIDAWRGGILLGFVFGNIADTTVTAPDTVVVKTKVPWVAFPAFLWVTGRAGIAAPAQLNNAATCDTNMIGTGPFQIMNGGSFDPATGDVKAVKNPNYWRKGFPYLNEIDFKPQEESSQRVNGLQGGQFDLIHGSGGVDLDQVQALSGVSTIIEPDGRMEISHTLPNVSKPPFDDINARKAVVMGVDRERLNQIANKGTYRIANQVFDTDIMGYVDNPGFPQYNPTEAKKLADAYKAAHGGKFEFNLQSTFDQTTQALTQDIKNQLAKIGITVNLPAPVDQATIISQAVGGAVDAFQWRNYPGQDPDTLYVWFYGGSVVNFNHVDDPVINQNLTEGRSSTDPAQRAKFYEAFNKRMSSQAYNLWGWYTKWFVGAKDNVHGIIGPNLPDESGKPGTEKAIDLLAGYHQLLGIWKSK
jgi:peptide/nickel transport system substrate-binding protein